MVNRVLLNTSGLKVSKPGFNVLTASLNQLSFSGDYSQINIFLTGSFSFQMNQVVSQTINFGKTFTFTPVMLGLFNEELFYNDIRTYSGDGTVGPHTVITTFKNRITITHDGNPRFYPPTFIITIRYAIMDYDAWLSNMTKMVEFFIK